MTVQLLCSDLDFALAYRCDAGCGRPAIIALTLPSGWESLRTEQGELLHRCGGCRFDLLVEPLIRDLGWSEASW